MTKQVLAYLGYRGAAADDHVLAMIAHAKAELLQACPPKDVSGIFKCHVDTAAGITRFNHTEISSHGLAAHLQNCQYIGIFAATLGVQADKLIHRYSITDMSRSVITDAVASVLVNDYCNRVCEQLSARPMVAGLEITRRFSPGYGDLSMEYQQVFLNAVDAGKRIGIGLTAGNMLVPAKSVTAAVGWV